MRHTLLLIISVLAFISSGLGQNEISPVVWSPKYKLPSRSTVIKIIQHEDGYYIIRSKRAALSSSNEAGPQKVIIEDYEHNLKLKKAGSFSLKYKSKKRKLEDIVLLKNKLYLLSSFHNKAKEITYLFAQEISRRSLSLKSRISMVGEIDTDSYIKSGAYFLEFSKDSSKVLIYNAYPEERKTPEKFTINVLDDSFNFLWTKEVSLPFDDRSFYLENYQVNNEGSVFLLGSNIPKKSTLKNELPVQAYYLYIFKSEGSIQNTYPIVLEDKVITDLTFRVATNGDIIIAGFYSEKDLNSIKGTFYMSLDGKTGELLRSSTRPFDFDFLTVGFSERKKRRAREAEEEDNQRRKAELGNFSLDKLLLRSDGGAVLVAEQSYVYVREDRLNDYYLPYRYRYSPYSYNNRYNREYVYNYNDIIIANITPSGEIEWASRVPKRQKTINDGGILSSYVMASGPENFYFIYNDHPGNLENTNEKLRTFQGSGVMTICIVNKDGESFFSPLRSTEDPNVRTIPAQSKQISSNAVMIYGQSSSHFRLGKLGI